MKIGIIGCGVIGGRRAAALPEGCSLVGCFDTDQAKAKEFASKYGGVTYSDLNSFVTQSGAQAVMISTVNSALVESAQACLDQGISILVEKPAARSFQELSSLKRTGNTTIKIGFNHRFHPAFEDLNKEIAQFPGDPVMYVRARYGNGARVGFNQEWRARTSISGGGELLDQGAHVLDLASVILTDLHVTAGVTRTQFWDMPVDDNAWAILSTPRGQTFSMHVSSSEWKNEFLFEVYTRKRKYVWSGLGRSYGPETLTIYKMKPEMGPPDVERREYPGEDLSWLKENTNFIQAISGKQQVEGGLENALQCLKLVEDIYACSKKLQGSVHHPEWWGTSEARL
ncbi:MAG: Gfo/Idh/MocA family oxidoreductase [Bdellovibrionia bacterium]